MLLSVLRARVLDFHNTVLTRLCVDNYVILDLTMIALHNVFLLFVDMTCVPNDDGLPIETYWTLPNEISNLKS
jgi:hypothetical protein